MGVRKFEDLIVWQLSEKLRQEVFALSAVNPAALDRDFCDQIRDSARSAPRNIAEGFGRYYPKEFARFLRIAAGSLQETRNHLIEACNLGYITHTDFVHLVRLALRAFKAATRLIAYLLRARPPEPYPWSPKRLTKAMLEPMEPVEPSEPIEPAEPSEPSEPSEPIEPIEPIEPFKP